MADNAVLLVAMLPAGSTLEAKTAPFVKYTNSDHIQM